MITAAPIAKVITVTTARMLPLVSGSTGGTLVELPKTYTFLLLSVVILTNYFIVLSFCQKSILFNIFVICSKTLA